MNKPNSPIRIGKGVALVAVCLCVFVPHVIGQDCPEFIGGVGLTGPFALSVSGDYAFVGSGYGGSIARAGLYVVNVSDPSAPLVVSSLVNDWSASEIGVSGFNVYVLDQVEQDVYIVDVSNPLAPVEVGHLSGDFWDLAISDHYLFLTDESGLRIMDLAMPSEPAEVGFLPYPSGDILGSSIAVAGGYVYMGTGPVYDFLVIDVQDPAEPIQVGQLHNLLIWDPVVDGDRVYGRDFCWNGSAPYHIVDVSEPTSPALMGTTGYAGCGPTAVSGSNLYISYPIFIGTATFLDVYDVSNASVPVRVESVEGSGGGGVFLANGLLYAVHTDLTDFGFPPKLEIFHDCDLLFVDSFESGDCSRWSATVP